MNENWYSAQAIQITDIHLGQAFTGLSNTTGNTATAISLTAREGTEGIAVIAVEASPQLGRGVCRQTDKNGAEQ